MKETDCILKLIQISQRILENTGMFRLCSLDKLRETESGVVGLIKPDFMVNVKTKDNKDYTLVFEVKSLGQPRYARTAINQLQGIISSKKNYYGIFGSTYISPESMKICRENNIGSIDLAGNCYIKFNNIYIEIQGKPNPYPSTRPLKSLFAQKSTRAVRVILSYPKKMWTVKELAKEAKLSLGLVSNIKRKLLDFEFIEEKNRKFTISNPELLLNKWVENYSYRKNEMKNYYSFDEINEIEKKIAEYLELNNICYAFTLTSGASRVAPFLRYNRAFVYISTSTDDLAQSLNWREVSSGPNVTLLYPYDESILWETQDSNGFKVVSDIQLYLDLTSYKERGEEAAKFLYENRLKNKW